MARKSWDETLAALGLNDAERETIEAAVEFGKQWSIKCTGCSVYPECTFPPLQVILLHGGVFAVNCPECCHINGAMIMGMGHGIYRQAGILHYASVGRDLSAMARSILAAPNHEVQRGRHWSAAQERKWRKSLQEYIDGGK